MKFTSMLRLTLTGTTLTALSAFSVLGGGAALAQAYPAKPIRLMVGYAAGGPVDNAARKLGPALAAELGQTVVIENRGGASGVLGADAIAKAEPDGYFLILQASPTQVMVPHITKSLPFDPVKDFTPISGVVGFATVLVVGKGLPVSNVQQLVAYARANPGKLSFGSAGIGASNHLAGELLAAKTDTQMLHVPYKGNALALTDVISGQISFMFNSVGDSLGFLKSGQVRGLAVGSKARSRVLPDVPTLIESGIPDFDVTAWYALEGPPRLPRAIQMRLNAAVVKVMNDPALSKAFYDLGYDPMPSTPEELQSRIQSDFERWRVVGRRIKID